MPSRRALALFVLLLIAGFVLGTAWDPCDDGSDCVTACHAACAGGCAAALVVGAAAGVVGNEVQIVAASASVDRPLSRAAEPDLRPPRA